MNKSAAIRDVAADMPDSSAVDIADEIWARYGVKVTPGSVRAVRSRDAARGVPANSSRPRTRLRVVREAEPDADADDYDDDVVDQPAYVHQQSPDRAPRPVVQPETVYEDQADEEFLALYDRVENAIRLAVSSGIPQQATGDTEFIQLISGIAADPEMRAANKPYDVKILNNPNGTQTLRIIALNMLPLTQPKGRSKRKAQVGCEWCSQSGRQSMPGVDLYVVSGGILTRATILCQLHCMQVITVPGTSAFPYRVFDQITGAAVIVPAETPMQRLRKQVMESAGSYFGMGQSLSEES